MARPSQTTAGASKFAKVHISYMAVIGHVKKILEKDYGKDVSIETVTYIMAKNSIIDGRKILIVIPTPKNVRHEISRKFITQNIYMA